MNNNISAALVCIPYDKEYNNCATLVCRYYRDSGYGSLPDGDLMEYTPSALLWVKNNFIKTDRIEKDCLLLVKNFNGTLHVAVFDGEYVLHNAQAYGKSIRQQLGMFLKENKNVRVYKWRH